MSKIGFVGLGNMGGPMALNLVNAGHDLVGFDLNDAATERLAEHGATTAETLAEVVADVDIVITMLPAGKHVRSVYTAADGLLSHTRPGTLIIDSSTIDEPHPMQASESRMVSV